MSQHYEASLPKVHEVHQGEDAEFTYFSTSDRDDAGMFRRNKVTGRLKHLGTLAAWKKKQAAA